MHIFVAAAYSAQIDYKTGEVFRAYDEWLEAILDNLEDFGHTIFNSVRADPYRINDTDPALVFQLDVDEITKASAVIAVVGDMPSSGVQTEIGIAVMMHKKVILAHAPEHHLGYFNAAMLQAGIVREISLPLTKQALAAALAV